MSVEIRTIAPDEVARWVDAMRTGFLEPPAPDPTEAEFRGRPLRPRPRLGRGRRRRASWAPCAASTPPWPCPGDQVVSAAALTHVTVSASHRRRGLLSEMITADLRSCAERGDAVGTLVAAEWPIYGRFGYGAGGRVGAPRGRHPRPGHPRGPRRARSSWWTATPSGSWPARSTTVTRPPSPAPSGGPTGGGTSRSATSRSQGRTTPTFFVIGRDDDGRPDGFLSLRHQGPLGGSAPPQHPRGRTTWSGVDPTASNRLWRYCLEIDWVATVSAGDHWVSDPLRWILGDARAMAEHERTDLLWVRLLDVAAALAGRRYLCPGRVVLEVDDAMGLSGGRFALDGGPDGAECAPTTDPADLALSVSTLSSAYLGGYTLADLARGGRVERAPPRRPGHRRRHVPLPRAPLVRHALLAWPSGRLRHPGVIGPAAPAWRPAPSGTRASPRRAMRRVPGSTSRAASSSRVTQRRASDSWLPATSAPAGATTRWRTSRCRWGALAGERHPVDVQVDRRDHHGQTGDAGLLGGLAPGHAGQVGVTVGVAARLEPTLGLAVEQHEHVVAPVVDHQGRAGQVAVDAGARQGVGVRGRRTRGCGRGWRPARRRAARRTPAGPGPRPARCSGASLGSPSASSS